MVTIKRLVAIIAFCVLFILCLYLLFPSSRERELLSAYDRFNQVQEHAWLTLDTSGLSEVATGEILKFNIEGIKKQRERGITNPVSDRVLVIPILGFDVLEYQSNYANFRIWERRIAVRIDKQTGRLIYGSNANWFEHEIEMVMEEGIWKVNNSVMIENLFDER